MTDTNKKDNEETLVIAEAIRFFYSHLSEVTWLQMIFPLVVGGLFFNSVEKPQLIIWLVFTLSIYLLRIILIRKYLKTSPPPNEAPQWGNDLAITTLISGFLWGYAAFTFNDPDQIYNGVILDMIIIGIVAGSVILTTYWLPVFYTFTIPSMLGVILDQLIHFPSSQGYIPALLLTIFTLLIFRIANSSNKTAYNAIKLRFKNTELIEKLEEEKKKAEAASSAKTHFLASANHDLRQPVHALSLLVHGLKKELKSAQGKLLFFRLEQSVNNLGNLLESLLDLSRLDASAVKVTPTQFSIASISSQMLADFLPIANRKGLRFSVRTSDDFIFTDRTLLERLLRNLLNNAFRYTQSGGVLLGFRKRKNDLIFEIWDTGIGISDDEKDKIFSEFYQSGNTERDRSKGLGLGLSICQRITSLLGTEINYHSIEGKGSVFRFKLPITENREIIEDFLPSNHSNDDNKVIDLTGKIILIVDDDLEVLRAMIQLIKNWEMIPLTARDSVEAFETLEQRHLSPDIMICDHRLNGDETGLDVVKKIQSRYQIPALMITGDTAPENLLALDNSGLIILHKPVQPDVLYKTLGGLLP